MISDSYCASIVLPVIICER